ncbi:hypothetical protein K438DRAFT_1756828 [Mycena galopus ATCC 62051]|nr:hypothetical protein K438DRAFT_1756828 [Mycena galopus ATCC 62051]
MHRALEIVEIVETICEKAAGLERNSESDSDFRLSHVATLARTCSFVLNPALNVLWRRQTTIKNILKCMPDDLWCLRQNYYGLRRSITAADWERPLFYMDRVKVFSCLETDFGHTYFLEALRLSLPGHYLFPNLEELTWSPLGSNLGYGRYGSPFHHLRLFLAPHISKLSLGNIRTNSDLSVLCGLAVNCPLLTTINVAVLTHVRHDADGIVEQDVIPCVSAFVRSLKQGLKRIESLKVPGLDDKALVYLAQAPALESLEIKSVQPSLFSSWHPDDLIFPTLTRLVLPTMDDTHRLISLWDKRSLVELESGCTGSNFTNIVAHQFFSALERRSSHSALRTLHVGSLHNTSVAQSGGDLGYAVGGEALHHLFAFTALVKVILITPVGFDLDDTTIGDLARAWPQIEELCLCASPHRHVYSRVTLEGIYAFAEHCPELEELSITLDASIIPQLTVDGGRQRASQEALRRLDVGLSPVSDGRAVGKFLSSVFPELSMIVSPRREDSGEIWEAAESFLIHNRASNN